MKNIKKYYLVIIGIFLLSTMVNPFLELKVNADTVNQGLIDALNTAPQGIDLSNGRFKMPETAEDGNPYVNPVSSKVVAATDGSSNSNRIVQVVNAMKQVGGIWGDPSRNNYISTNKKQTISLWINMSKASTGKYDPFGDGLAFVIQNDDRKINAMATTKDTSRIDNGETLGVWGYDNYGTEDPSTGKKDVASKAIQNSWALEIDTYPDAVDRNTMPDDGSDRINSSSSISNVDEATMTENNDAKVVYNNLLTGNSTSDSFDIGHGRHIASGFPGDPETYTPHTVKWFKDIETNKVPFLGTFTTALINPQFAYYYSLNHTMPSSDGMAEEYFDRLTDPTRGEYSTMLIGWHHLTITVDFPNKKIDYHFNDKNVDGTAIATKSQIFGETKLTDADVNGTGRFGKIKDDRLMFGFTGSTGDAAMNGLAVFEQIPGFAETDVTTDFKDISSGKDLTSTSDFAYSGEQLKLNYNLTYTDGNEAWTGVKSHIVLPKNVNYTPDSDGNIGTVSVGGTSAKIPATDIETDSSGNNILVCGLPGNGTMNTGETSTATYSINGIAGDVTADTTVASTHSRFIGDNGISDVDSPAFTIKQPDIKLTSTTENPLTINKGQGATINGLVTNASGSAVTNSDMTVHLIVNGKTLDPFQMSNSDPVGQLTAKIAKDYLTSDTNTAQIYVTNGSKTSNSIMFTIKTKDGGLSLNSYPKSAKFKTVNTTKKNQIISRSGDWDLSVLDSRGDNNGAGNTWRLMAKSNQLHIGDTNFNGSIIFKTGNNSTSLTNNEVPIATGETISKDPVTTDIDSTWTDNSGVLLKSNGQNPSGTYNGSIEWTLYDSI